MNRFRITQFVAVFFIFLLFTLSPIQPNGLIYSQPAGTEKILVPQDTDKKVLIPFSDIGSRWRTDINFDDADWLLCSGKPGGIGYEMGSGYEPYITLDVGDRMYQDGHQSNTSCYIRIPFHVTEETLNSFRTLFLIIRYDDGFIAWLNGTKVAEANAPEVQLWDSPANSAIESDGPATFNISSYIKDLSAGENLFAVQGLNAGTNSSDFLITCEVVADPERTGDFVSSNLPLLFIDTQGQTIPDDPRIDAIMGIVDNGPGELNDVTDPWNHYNGHIGIELRGSTSRGFPKKPYRIETLDALGNNLNVSLLGMPAENDWVLHNPWSDKTQMRNVLAYKISRDIGRYASRTRFCELFLNGEYQGIYVLMEKLKRDKNRVDIERLDIDDTAGDSLTGGYIIKIDKMDGEQVGGWMDGNIFYQYHYPQPNDITEEQKNYIEDFMTKFGTAVRQGERDGSDAAYADYIDLESFVNHFLINEISRNIDAYRLSAFMYKDRDSNDSRLTMGPVWDFNLSFGNGDYYNGWETEGWNLDHLIAACGGDFAPPFWWKTIRNSHRFLSTLKRRWAVLRPDILSTDRLLNYIDAVADTLDEAQKRNFEKWPTLGTYLWPNWFVGETYEEEIYFMKQWLAGRLEWMDKAIGEISEVADTPPGDSGFHLNQNYPNPFNSETRILYRLSNAGNVRIRIYAVNGSPVRTLIRDTYLADGNYTAVWNGRDENGKNAPSGVYFCRFEFFHNKSFYSQTRKMVLVR